MNMHNPTMSSIDELVRTAVDTFPGAEEFTVGEEAVEALVAPGEKEFDHIRTAVFEGKATTDQIVEALRQQLRQAADSARAKGRTDILPVDIEASLKLKCWFYPWC